MIFCRETKIKKLKIKFLSSKKIDCIFNIKVIEMDFNFLFLAQKIIRQAINTEV